MVFLKIAFFVIGFIMVLCEFKIKQILKSNGYQTNIFSRRKDNINYKELLERTQHKQKKRFFLLINIILRVSTIFLIVILFLMFILD